MTQRLRSTTTNRLTYNCRAVLKYKLLSKSLSFRLAKQFQPSLQFKITFAKSEGNSTCTTKRWSLLKNRNIHRMCLKSLRLKDPNLVKSTLHQTLSWQRMTARETNPVNDQLPKRVKIFAAQSRAKAKQASHNVVRKKVHTTVIPACMKWKTPPVGGTMPTLVLKSSMTKKTFAAIRPKTLMISKTYPFLQTQLARMDKKILKTWANSLKIISLLTGSSCFATCLQANQRSKDRLRWLQIKIWLTLLGVRAAIHGLELALPLARLAGTGHNRRLWVEFKNQWVKIRWRKRLILISFIHIRRIKFKFLQAMITTIPFQLKTEKVCLEKVS